MREIEGSAGASRWRVACWSAAIFLWLQVAVGSWIEFWRHPAYR